MAITRGIAVGSFSALLIWLILAWSAGRDSTSQAAGARVAADVSAYISYIVVDGPFSGTTLYPDSTGNASSKKGGVHGFVRAPSTSCHHYHFEGFFGGGDEKKIKIKETDCTRVVPRDFATNVMQSLSAAVGAEQRGRLDTADEQLTEALKDADASDVGQGQVIGRLKKRIKKAMAADEDVGAARKAGDKKKAEALLEKALDIKQKALDDLPLEVKMYLPPTLKPIDAVFDQANFQTVYTWGIVPRPGSLITYTWSFAELNDPNCVDFRPNSPTTKQATWYHPHPPCGLGLDGPNGHMGVIGVVSLNTYYTCTAVYVGSFTGTGPVPPPCQPQI